MDENWVPGPPTPLADMKRVMEATRRYSTPLDEMVQQKQAELVARLHDAQDAAMQRVLDAGIDPRDVEIVTEQVSALGDPIITYTVTARWKVTNEPL